MTKLGLVKTKALPHVREVSGGLHEGQGEEDGWGQEDADGQPVLQVDVRLDDPGLLSLAVLVFRRLNELSRVFGAAVGAFRFPGKSFEGKSLDSKAEKGAYTLKLFKRPSM